MTIPPISSGITPITTGPIGPGTGAADTNGQTGAAAFDIAGSLQGVAELQSSADVLGQAVATGDASDLHDFTAAASKASMAMELTVAVRDRAVEAYQTVINMQI